MGRKGKQASTNPSSTRNTRSQQNSNLSSSQLSDTEPLISLESDRSSSDESNTLSHKQQRKKARTSSTGDMDVDFANSSAQEKTAAGSDNNPQQIGTAGTQIKNVQPPADQPSTSGNPAQAKSANQATFHEQLEEFNKEFLDKETAQNDSEPSSKTSALESQHATKSHDIEMINQDHSAAIIADTNYYKAAAPIADLMRDNETKNQCINRLNNFGVDKLESFFKAVRIGNNSSGKIVLLVKDKKDHEFLVNNTHDELRPAENKDIPVFFNYDPQAILQDKKRRSLVVRDIPLFITKDNITARFKNFGLIEYIKMHVPHNAMFQIAEIVYEDLASISSFYQGHWSLFIKGECVRIFPATMTNEDRALRQQHTAILRNLPTNIHAIDLCAIYSEVNAVLIGLPRHAKSYQI